MSGWKLSRHVTAALYAVIVFTASGWTQDSSSPIMTLVVDETQAARRIAFVHEEIKVRPGTIALAYPKWIPGEHGPTGPIQQVAAIRIHAGDKSLTWTRDPEEIFTIHVDIPAAVEKITVDFDTLLENTISDHQILLAWNSTILYPLGIDKRELMIAPSLQLPATWKQSGSLHVTGETGGRVDYAPASLERLIDSPILAGEFLRAIPLHASWPAELDVTGDTQSDIDKVNDEHAVDMFTKLVDQDHAMFGFRHWQTMHFLVSQSAARPFDGLEHEDAPYDAVGDAALSKKSELEKFGWPLLAHEQSHSWDGKYRRPGELYSKPDYQGPERTSLLWVYEGLNEYIGMLLATRSGFNDANYARDYWADSAATFILRKGRESVPLVDTASDDWVLRTVEGGWTSIRRSQDYYDEGALIWMRVDTIIREKTQNRASLDDFLRSFLGQRDTGPVVEGYTREDVEAALQKICPFDWHGFFEARVYQVNGKPPTEGFEAAGWRLIYNDKPEPEFFWAATPGGVGYIGAYSIGMDLKKDGTIADVMPDTPAYEAGLGPQMKVIAVEGRAYSNEVLDAAVAHPRDGKISLTVRNFETVKSFELKYAGGVRYPHLERIPGTHDYLSEILTEKSYK